MISRFGTPLAQRKGDWVFVVGFGLFAFTSLFFDLQSGLGVPEDANVFTRANGQFARAADPVLLDPPLWFCVMSVVSGLVYGPFYVLLVWAFVKGWNGVRTAAFAYVGAIELSMVTVGGVALLGAAPPTNVPLWLGAYAPYALLPLALAYRFRRAEPFGARRG